MIDRGTFYRLMGVPTPTVQATRPSFGGTGMRDAPAIERTAAIQGGQAADDLVSLRNIMCITSAGELEPYIPAIIQAPLIGLDSETTGLDCISDRLRLVQIAATDAVFIVDCAQVNPMALAPVLGQARKITGHNLKFDLNFLAQAGLPIPDGRHLFDTMLAAQLLGAGTDDGRLENCGLAAVVKRYLGLPLDKSFQRAGWSGPLPSEQIQYAAIDAAVLLPLAEKLEAALAAGNLVRVANLEMRALPAVAWLERTGAPFDGGRWVELSDGAVAEQIRLEQALTAMTGAGGVQPGGVPRNGGHPINWSSPKQVCAVLRDRGHEVRQTDEATLRRLSGTDPLAHLLLEYREACRKASAYGIDFLRHVHPTMDRIHPDYLQIGAASGRMSCRRPNLQQVPRESAYRACFRPGEGRCLVKADFSQIELRVVAEITGDERMTSAYRRGEDLHKITAISVLGRQDEQLTAGDRQAAKALNFGLVYGMGAPSLREHAANSYGVAMTQEEAEAFRGRFFSTYPGVRRWQLSQPRGMVETRTLSGRRRQGVDKYWTKLNTPVQGTGADGFKAALALLWERRDVCPGAAPVLAVHDEIVLECPVEEAQAARVWLVESMKRGMGSFLRHVPVQVDSSIMSDWSGTKLTSKREQM